MPTLSAWAALRAVVEQGGVLPAAEVLHVGQPAITKRLRSLEACYGLALTERVGGRLRLTPAGEKVYVLAAQTLERQKALHEELRQLGKGLESMRLEATHAIGEHLLAELLMRFSERYPRFKVDSRVGYARRIHAHLAANLANLALLERAPDHPDILVQKWFDDELWLICGMTHPLAGTDLLPLEQLSEQTYVLREAGSSPRLDLEAALIGVGIDELRVVLEIGSTEPILEILENGKHLSFLPQFAVKDRVQSGELFHIKISGFRIMRTLWIARNRQDLEHPVAEAFIETARDQL